MKKIIEKKLVAYATSLALLIVEFHVIVTQPFALDV